MYDITYFHEATSVQDAVRHLTEHPEAKVIAGGTDVLVQIREGRFGPTELVSIHELKDELWGVTLTDDEIICIGPITWFQAVNRDPICQERIPVLCDACDTPGGPQLRVSGTIGGNVANGITSADTASTLFALGARMVLEGPDGQRVVPIEEWYAGPGKTVREQNELLVSIQIPRDHYEGFTGDYIKYGKRNALEIATMGCCCLVKLAADHETIEDVRFAYGVAGPNPCRSKAAEDAARGKTVAEAAAVVGDAALEDLHPRDSWRASKDFRMQLIKEMTRRALVNAANKGGSSASWK